MIYCSNNNTKGRLGNAVMRIMSLMGIAEQAGTTWAIPEWKYARYFENEIPQWSEEAARNRPASEKWVTIKEPHYHYYGDMILKELAEGKNVDINGYLQSPKYWKEKLRFTNEFKLKCCNKLPIHNVEDNQAIAISIRRGDFIGNGAYLQLGPMYYIGALLTHFPRWRESQLVFFSDDIEYCKVHFGCMPNAVFAEGLSDIEQLCLMTQCTDYILSNSTFSYCGAYLSDWAEGAKVIRPKQNFSDEYHARGYSEKDYWPEGWTIFDHTDFKLDISDVTFTIPVKHDHDDRKKNLDLSLCMLQRDFKANYIVMEQLSTKGLNEGDQAPPARFAYIQQWAKYIKFGSEHFHRTKMLNEMAKAAETPYIVNWDADMVCPPLQLYLAVEALRAGDDMVYPYDGSFARVPRMEWFRKLEKALDIGIVGNTQFKGKRGGPMPTSSVGGAVLFNKESFIRGGMENEYMISYAPEDCERYDRFTMLGFKVRRIAGTIYHIDHFVGIDSGARNPFFKANKEELEKIRGMNRAQLWEYVSTWPWLEQYNGAYFEAISPESIKSAEKVYKYLQEVDLPMRTIIDVGCGIGHWGKNCPGTYWGIDHNIPESRLLFPSLRYKDIDLRNPKEYDIPYEKFDLALCLEVAEHLPESVSDKLVEFLCMLSNRVLFSAAIPYQGGAGHINEQWQTWWAAKFAKQGYYPSDLQLRGWIAKDEDIAIWYRQNMVIYERGGRGTITDYVHPGMWLNHMQEDRKPTP